MKKIFATALIAGAFFCAKAEEIDEIEKAEEAKAHCSEKRQTIITEKESVSEQKAHHSEKRIDSKIKNIEVKEEENAQIEETEDINIQKAPTQTEQYDEDKPLIPDQMQNLIEDDLKSDESSDEQKQ